MTANFNTMKKDELKAYVLQNREDQEAFYALIDRLKKDSPTKSYPCPNTPENLQLMKQAIREKLEQLPQQT